MPGVWSRMVKRKKRAYNRKPKTETKEPRQKRAYVKNTDKTKAGKHDPVSWEKLAAMNITRERIEQLAGKEGLIDTELAAELGISHRTLCYWKDKLDGFKELLDQNKIKAVSEIVKTLFQRCKGVSYTERKVIRLTTKREIQHSKHLLKEKGIKVEPGDSVIRIEDTQKFIPGDPQLIRFYLSNRDPQTWRQMWRVDVSADVKTENNSNINVNLANLGNEDLDKLQELLPKLTEIKEEAIQ